MRKDLFLSFFSLFLFLTFLVLFFDFSFFSQIKRSNQEILLKKEKILALENKIENLRNLKKNYSALKENLARIDQLFVKKEMPVDFLDFLEKISQDSRIDLEVSSLAFKEEEKEFWPAFFLQVNFTGSFPNFRRFLEQLENSPYLISLQSLNINQISEKEILSPKKEKASIIGGNLSFFVYSQ